MIVIFRSAQKSSRACFPSDIFLDVMRHIDFAFIDEKHMDSQARKAGTGVGNERILENIRLLKQSRWRGRLVLRQNPSIGPLSMQ